MPNRFTFMALAVALYRCHNANSGCGAIKQGDETFSGCFGRQELNCRLARQANAGQHFFPHQTQCKHANLWMISAKLLNVTHLLIDMAIPDSHAAITVKAGC